MSDEVKKLPENLIRVLDPETGDVKKIDANKEKDFKKKYLHVSGLPFEE